MDLNQIEENFFYKLNIKRLAYRLYYRQQELDIYAADLSQISEDFGAILRNFKVEDTRASVQ